MKRNQLQLDSLQKELADINEQISQYSKATTTQEKRKKALHLSKLKLAQQQITHRIDKIKEEIASLSLKSKTLQQNDIPSPEHAMLAERANKLKSSASKANIIYFWVEVWHNTKAAATMVNEAILKFISALLNNSAIINPVTKESEQSIFINKCKRFENIVIEFLTGREQVEHCLNGGNTLRKISSWPFRTFIKPIIRYIEKKFSDEFTKAPRVELSIPTAVKPDNIEDTMSHDHTPAVTVTKPESKKPESKNLIIEVADTPVSHNDDSKIRKTPTHTPKPPSPTAGDAAGRA